MNLPVEELREAFESARARHQPLVIQSPTGSGKSSLVPLWCLQQGSVLVVEPRRVAARALARRCAELLGEEVGGLVGYATRGDARHDKTTRLLFATPGVALSLFGSGEISRFSSWILDEFHERRTETDLLLAAARARGELGRTVLLSATLETRRLEEEWGFLRLSSTGREYPVDIEHLCDPGQRGPEAKGLTQRVERALVRLDQPEGTVLVFLPGVGEIAEAAAWLASRHDWDILPLHGALAPEIQDRAFAPSVPGRLRVVLATNVAESAVTVPDVAAVIDSGLERRIEHDGPLSALSLGSISQASADQRAGRAGRTRPGRALRLWHHALKLRSTSPPQILVEDPASWLLPAVAAGIDPTTLPWLDRPLASGLRRGIELLEEAGLLHRDEWQFPEQLQLTPTGRRVFAYPLDPMLAALCVRLEGTPAWKDGLALATALSGRPLPLSRPDTAQMQVRQELSCAAGDTAFLAAAVQAPQEVVRAAGVHIGAWREAREEFERLRNRMGCAPEGWPRDPQGRTLALEFSRLLPSQLRLRQNPSRPTWSAPGGRALHLSQGSLQSQLPPAEVLLALSVHGNHRADGKIVHYAEAAQGFSRAEVLSEGLGRLEVQEAWEEDGTLQVRVRHVVAGQPLGESVRAADTPQLWAQGCVRMVPTGDLARVREELSRWWLQQCLDAGHWIAPPGDERAFLVQALLEEEEFSRHRPPRPPLRLPRPPTADEARLALAFPPELSGEGWKLSVTPDVWRGRIELRPLEGRPPVKLDRIGQPEAWKGWTLACRMRK